MLKKFAHADTDPKKVFLDIDLVNGSNAGSKLGSFILICLFLVSLSALAGGCQKKEVKPVEKYPMPSEESVKELKDRSVVLLSTESEKITSTKVLQVSKLDTYGLPDNTLGTLKQMVDENKNTTKNMVVVEGTRDNGEKVYVLWKQNEKGEWNP